MRLAGLDKRENVFLVTCICGQSLWPNENQTKINNFIRTVQHKTYYDKCIVIWVKKIIWPPKFTNDLQNWILGGLCPPNKKSEGKQWSATMNKINMESISPSNDRIRNVNYPHAFLKKRRGYCNRLRPSVRLSVTLSPPKPLDEIQTNLVCELLTWMGCATAHFFIGPAPWGPGEGPKGQISLNIIKFQLQSQFQRFFNQTLCVFSHIKDIKHIRRDFHLVAWVQGSDLGVPWRVWGVKFFFFSKFNQIWCVSYLHEWHMHRHHVLGPHPPGAIGRGQNVKYH